MLSPFGFLGTQTPFTSSGYPLNDFSGAEVAYSFRRLRSNYNGNVVQLKRTFDNSTADFGFASGSDYLDTASADAWCSAGGGACSISAWYDQSENGRGLAGGTYQPDFVNSSDLTSKKAISFNGSDDTLTWNTGAGTALYFATQSTEILVADNGYSLMDESTPRGLSWTSNNISVEPSASTSVAFTSNSTSSIVAGILDHITFRAYADGALQGSASIASGAVGNMSGYGSDSPTAYVAGNHYEYIRWNKVMDEAKLQSVMDSINDFYSTPNYI